MLCKKKIKEFISPQKTIHTIHTTSDQGFTTVVEADKTETQLIFTNRWCNAIKKDQNDQGYTNVRCRQTDNDKQFACNNNDDYDGRYICEKRKCTGNKDCYCIKKIQSDGPETITSRVTSNSMTGIFDSIIDRGPPTPDDPCR